MSTNTKISSLRFVVIGRAGMDLYPEPAGTKIADATSFTAMLGGSAANIAAGLCRLGHRASLFTALSDDAVGRYCTNQLEKFGIERDMLSLSAPETRSSLALSESRIEDHETLIYRNGAADFDLSMELAEALDFSEVRALILTGTALAREPSRSVTMRAIERAREAGIDVVLDLDYRPYSWTSPEDASATYLAAARQCQIVIGNDEEFAVLSGADSPDPAHAKALLKDGVELCVYKMGQGGSICFDATQEIPSGIFPVKALKPVGAGDSFMASFLAGLYDGRSLQQSVTRGSAAAAMVVTRKGCAGAMPTPQEVTDFIASNTMTTAGKA